MKCPFPGMDPYLEQHWEDVHTRLIGYIADELQPQLSTDLIARMEEKVYVEDENEVRRRKPDVRFSEVQSHLKFQSAFSSTAMLDEPIYLEPIDDPMPERSVRIYDSSGNRIITAIEILSPWNKSPGKAVREYLKKRKKYIESEINLVEIDLIRQGDWTEMIGPFQVPDGKLTTYRVTVVPSDDAGILQYPVSISAKLPTIAIPLRAQDEPARLNLQSLFEKAYTMGRYDRIDYSKPCKPPFDESEQEWAAQLISQPRID